MEEKGRNSVDRGDRWEGSHAGDIRKDHTIRGGNEEIVRPHVVVVVVGERLRKRISDSCS